MAKRINKRGKIERHRITPGVMIDNITYREMCKKSSVAGIKTQDTQNRKYVINKIIESISKGMTEEEALDIIMKDNIIQEFEYLKNNGCNIRECFRNWARGYKNKKDKEISR